MSVTALFTLDNQMLRAAQRQMSLAADTCKKAVGVGEEAISSLDSFLDNRVMQKVDWQSWVDQSVEWVSQATDQATVSEQPMVLMPVHESNGHESDGYESVPQIPVLYWLDRSLRQGVVDSLAKLNPTLLPDPSVHAFYLAALSKEARFSCAKCHMAGYIQAFQLTGRKVRSGVVGTKPELLNTLYGQFGYFCLLITQEKTRRRMALGLRTMPESVLLFDASLGLLEMATPQDLGNLLSSWLEDPRSPWLSALYELWRVTL